MKIFLVLSVLVGTSLGAPDGDHAPNFNGPRPIGGPVAGPRQFGPGGPGAIFGGPRPAPFIGGPRPIGPVPINNGPRPFGPAGPIISGPRPILGNQGQFGPGGPSGTIINLPRNVIGNQGQFGPVGPGPIIGGQRPILGNQGQFGSAAAGPGHIIDGPRPFGPEGPGPFLEGSSFESEISAPLIGSPAQPLNVGGPSIIPASASIIRPAPISNYSPAPVYGETVINDGPAVYSFNYGVKDDYAGLNFGHNENRDGYNTQGTYYVNLPDGRLQTVNYHADQNGYVADVQYSGNAVAPSYAPAPRPAYGPLRA